MAHIAIDLIGGFPEVDMMRNGHIEKADSVLTITCLLCRVTVFLATNKHVTGEGAAALILDEFSVGRGLGHPSVIVSDRDPRFNGEAFRQTMARLGIEQRMTVRDHAEANGAAEVMNKALSKYLRLYCSQQPRRWVEALKYAEASINSGINASLGYKPGGGAARVPTALWVEPDRGTQCCDRSRSCRERRGCAHANVAGRPR